MNLADPSPGLGWRGLERKSLPERGKPDLVLALALVHHVAISANVPVKEFVDWLASLGSALVIEFPTREDPMVKKLLAPKRDGLHPDYELGFFERTLGRGVRGRALRAPGVGHARALFRASEEGMTAAEAAGAPASGGSVARESALGLPQPGRAVDLRGRPAAVRPAEGQPRVLRRPRLVGLRRHLLLGAAGGAAAGGAAWRGAAGWAGRAQPRAAARTWSFIAALVALIAAQALKKAFDASDLVLIVLSVAIGAGVAALYAARRAGALVPAASCRRRR